MSDTYGQSPMKQVCPAFFVLSFVRFSSGAAYLQDRIRSSLDDLWPASSEGRNRVFCSPCAVRPSTLTSACVQSSPGGFRPSSCWRLILPSRCHDSTLSGSSSFGLVLGVAVPHASNSSCQSAWLTSALAGWLVVLLLILSRGKGVLDT